MDKCLADFAAVKLENATVFHGSNLDVLPFMADNSVDSIVTDPPYELGFMGKKWDSTGIAYSVELWRECLRVLKPGGHLLAFGGSRTWHRLAVAIEDAGFEVRDSIAWLYGSGFPKSLDISKAIDRAAGAEREVVTRIESDIFGEREVEVSEIRTNEASGLVAVGQGERTLTERKQTLPATADAKKWQGWGTALKPAFEPIVVARKALIGTVAENVLHWGVGGLNIEGSRIGFQSESDRASATPQGKVTSNAMAGAAPDVDGGVRREIERPDNSKGRWPANIILDEYTAGLLDEQSGESKSPSQTKIGTVGVANQVFGGGSGLRGIGAERTIQGYGDSGGASRFFYVAKASKRDRNEGLDDLEPQRHADRVSADGVGGDNPRNRTNQAKQNFHPTVKPTDLMRYLIKLVTPAGGIVLDPFTGSGSTGKAALLDGYQFVGIELTDDYLPIIEGRLKWAEGQAQAEAQKAAEKEQETLF